MDIKGLEEYSKYADRALDELTHALENLAADAEDLDLSRTDTRIWALITRSS